MTLGGTVDILATDDPDVVAEEHEELQIYEKHNNLLHGSKRKRYARSGNKTGRPFCEKHVNRLVRWIYRKRLK